MIPLTLLTGADNIEFAVIHREADPDSAERLAGTRPGWATTEKVGGRKSNWRQPREGTRTPDREFVVLPDQFKRLGVGEAALISPTAEPRRSSACSRRGEGDHLA